jgi:hypothetical protein
MECWSSGFQLRASTVAVELRDTVGAIAFNRRWCHLVPVTLLFWDFLVAVGFDIRNAAQLIGPLKFEDLLMLNEEEVEMGLPRMFILAFLTIKYSS